MVIGAGGCHGKNVQLHVMAGRKLDEGSATHPGSSMVASLVREMQLK